MKPGLYTVTITLEFRGGHTTSKGWICTEFNIEAKTPRYEFIRSAIKEAANMIREDAREMGLDTTVFTDYVPLLVSVEPS